ncbi:glutaredoxin-2 domain protein [Capnocytophaga bilenii]
MPYIATINSNTPEALELINYLKTLDFVEIAEKASLNTSFIDEVLKEDEDGMPITYKDAILELSAKTKKTATKKFYEKYAKTNTL